MSEIWSSFSRWFNEKTSSPLYFTYIGFFIAWNWKFFQIIFWESETLFNSPRIEYLNNLNLKLIGFTPIDWLINFIWHIGPPALFTWLAIKYLPRLHAWAFDIHIKNHFARKSTYREEELNYEKFETKSLKKEVAQKTEQAKQKKIIEKTQTQEDKWIEEFELFQKNLLFEKFKEVIDSIYSYSGNISPYDRNRNDYVRIVSTDILALVHSMGLIEINVDKNDNQNISLTEKGKFFVSKYMENNILR